MGKVIVFIYDNMADFEISLLVQLLKSKCHKEIIVVSNYGGKVVSMSGMTYLPDYTLDDVSLDGVEGIIIPGGENRHLHDRLITIINHLNQSDKLLAAICFGPWMLAKAGVLKDRKYTSSIVKWQEEHSEFFGIQDPFPEGGYVEARVVRDKNIVTAKGAAFIDFAIEVCDYFGGFQDEGGRESFAKEYKG